MQKSHLKGDDDDVKKLNRADAATISDLTFKCCNYEFNDKIVNATIKLLRHVSRQDRTIALDFYFCLFLVWSSRSDSTSREDN
jgi:hypothetical protein